ncbi:uncharacterized protein LOC121728627 [Aricia agestis]|uniref:uncharacterized protein LOC121728627 n=1 Tax=Aricia agestis TaxID=91739 RepID=UPI001C20B55D|nr:uncharacterized protein LOC121728627 [Aricia agestis]
MFTLLNTLPLQIKSPFLRKLMRIGWRNFVDSSSDSKRNKDVMIQGTSLVHFRVRRARPRDMPRVIRFVQQNAPLMWPGANIPTTSKSHVAVMTDLLSRSLSQGHTMLAEQQEANRGWLQVRGLALNTSLTPWDATLLEKWAHCIQCDSSKKLILLSAQFLQAPGLHKKYMVSQILQILLLVPPDTPRASQVAQVLAKASMHRGQDLGYKVIRFDVTSDLVNKVLSELKLTKEWETNVDSVFTKETNNQRKSSTKIKKIIVYTAFPQRDGK